MATARKQPPVVTPQRAVLYARISDDRAEADGQLRQVGVRTQEGDLRAEAARLGWGVGWVIIENDTSAFKTRLVALPDGRKEMRVIRPGFRRVLDLLMGPADGLLALDLDRVARDQRDLADLKDLLEHFKVPRPRVASITGSLKLDNDADIAMAEVMVSIANKASRDTRRRVRRSRQRLASEGRFGGGPRRYGHVLEDGRQVVVPHEAAVIREAAERVLSGVGLIGIANDLNTRGVATVKGGRWTMGTLRDILLQPRIAGLMHYEGEVLEGVESCWEPIVARETWEALCALLNSPERRTTPGPSPKHLLTHLALCGHPSHTDDDRPHLIHGFSGQGNYRAPSYRCALSGHLRVHSERLDEYVEAVVIGLLRRPDATELLAPRVEVDVAGLAAEANMLRARLSELGDLVESGDMGAAEYRKRKDRLTERIASAELELTAAAGTSPLAGIAGRPDAGEIWSGLSLPARKAVIAALFEEVVVLPAKRGTPVFDETRVRLAPRGVAEAAAVA
jgi:site-specific DNA recombinase